LRLNYKATGNSVASGTTTSSQRGFGSEQQINVQTKGKLNVGGLDYAAGFAMENDGEQATTLFNENTYMDITNPGSNYQVAPVVNITGGGGTGALATASIDVNIDKPNSFGDNNKFKTQSQDVLFSVTNPFGEIDNTNNP
jgi:hypothetical protein